MKINQIDDNRISRVILLFYSVGFLTGTATHLYSIMVGGFLSISHLAPWYINLYWDSLTIVDLLASILVWFKLKQGLLLAIAIMASDIIINTYSYLSGWFGNTVSAMVPVELLVQSVFGTFVFVTATLFLSKRFFSK